VRTRSEEKSKWEAQEEKRGESAGEFAKIAPKPEPMKNRTKAASTAKSVDEDESATDAKDETTPGTSSLSKKKCKRSSSERTRTVSEKAAVSKYPLGASGSSHIGSIPMQIKTFLTSYPMEFPMCHSLPFMAHVYDDRRDGAMLPCHTVDSVVPFQLAN